MVCTIFPDANDTLDIAFNTLTSKNDLLCLPVLTVLHAEERGTPENREAINWKLVTDLPIHSRQQAIEKTELVCVALEDRNLP